MKTVTIQLQNLDYHQRNEFGITAIQMANIEETFERLDRMNEFYDNLLYDGFEALYYRLTVGKANLLLMALNRGLNIEYIKPYQHGYNPNKDIENYQL